MARRSYISVHLAAAQTTATPVAVLAVVHMHTKHHTANEPGQPCCTPLLLALSVCNRVHLCLNLTASTTANEYWSQPKHGHKVAAHT